VRSFVPLLLLAAGATSAWADAPATPSHAIDVPADWHEDSDASARVAASTRRESHFQGASFSAEVHAWLHPARAVLYVTELSASAKGEDARRAVRAELDAIATAPGGDRTAIAELDRRESVDAGIAEVTLHWRHLSSETETFVRALAFVSAERVHLVRADCVLASDVPSEVGQACKAALATLKPTAVVDSQALATVPAAASENPVPSPGAEIGPVGDEPRILYVGEPKSSKNHRWLFLLGGVLLVVAVVLTTRRRSDDSRVDDGPERQGDAGSADAGSADAGSADAGSADAGSADAGSADAGNADAGSADHAEDSESVPAKESSDTGESDDQR